MSSLREATPLQIAAFQERKARLARIASRAFLEVVPKTLPEVIAPRSALWFWMVDTDVDLPFVNQPLSIDRIKRAVAEDFDLTVIDLISDRRTANLILPRQIAFYLAKTLTTRSLPEIGRRFGGKDHTTVLHAVRKLTRLIPEDSVLAERIEAIRNTLGA